ncbi:IucA/IucC family protein [Tenacibaculum sp. MAR_2009_124]|uniref:IucA/IucC family protein n=1 Tax=Tenacibaculum sp. MAR_2009_124 TaxID=1250059 RepID=UPI000B1A297A|nr:IucA/IucC family siderophore biosynthesis protein [Tenacibaculum sp. MAR_2009_124]
MNNEEITFMNPETWGIVNKHLVKKAISEFTHELILTPIVKFNEIEGAWNVYELISDNADITYQFKAKKFHLDHWSVDVSSIRKFKNEQQEAIDMLLFITEFRETLGIPDQFLATYLEEITSTLISAAYKHEHEEFSSKELANLGFQEIEHAMSEGHPCFVANNGRIGFNIKDYHKYAPETNNPFKILWIAAHKKYATYTAIEEYDYHNLLISELGVERINQFNEVLEKKELSKSDYIFMPVHPWQWTNKLVHVFASDVANKLIVLLGESGDDYSAQQSIRTLFNLTNPKKLYTKTSLSILNMGFVRGLSPYYMQSTPHITKWIDTLLESDTYLKEVGFEMLGEVATVGYHNHYYNVLGKTNPHNKMLSALWRESPYSKITSTQKVATMASLLHIDKNGTSLLAEFIKSSGIKTGVWVEKYLKAYFKPLIHCFYKYELVFMPHGENIILVLENNQPVSMLMKDITEEVIVFNEEMYLPEHADRLFAKTTDKMKILSIFTDVFDCIFRFLGQILDTYCGFTEDKFWELVAKSIKEYQQNHPELQEKYEKYNLFVSEFDRCCLNKLQLSNTKQMLDLTDPIESLKLSGVLKNPIAKYVDELVELKPVN